MSMPLSLNSIIGISNKRLKGVKVQFFFLRKSVLGSIREKINFERKSSRCRTKISGTILSYKSRSIFFLPAMIECKALFGFRDCLNFNRF